MKLFVQKRKHSQTHTFKLNFLIADVKGITHSNTIVQNIYRKTMPHNWELIKYQLDAFYDAANSFDAPRNEKFFNLQYFTEVNVSEIFRWKHCT